MRLKFLENTEEVEIIKPPISQEKESRDQPFYSGVFSSLDKSASIFSRDYNLKFLKQHMIK